MRQRVLISILFVIEFSTPVHAQQPRWWNNEVEESLAQSKDNRKELETALHQAPKEQRPGIAFLLANMPPRDLVSLKADFLLKNLDLAYRARAGLPWGKAVPEELFLNDVLPYASATETREPWRQEMMDRCLPIVAGCKTMSDAVQALNRALYTKVNVKYSTQRSRPDQSPSESMKSGMASCTGLSILLIDACRSVGIPARLVGIPKWVNKPGNHMWVEIWDGDWHFTGACEPDPKGLDRGWFVGDAALARKDSVANSIYASSFKRTSTSFPLVWAPRVKDVFAENVTERYTRGKKQATGELSNEHKAKIFEAARAFFDSGRKLDSALDEFLRTNEDAVREQVWKAYAQSKLHQGLKADFDANQATNDKHLSPYVVKHVGKKPAAGWPLFIAMHGGGNAPKTVNDSQWKVMQKYYRDQDSVEGYAYVALRAPNDTWNGFYDDYMCPLVTNLIRQFVLFGEVDANKVFIMGYSHGGYGAFFIGPKIPDRFAAIHSSAAAQTDNTISAKSLRNTRFTFMIGEKDTAYGRRERCEKFAAEIEKLRADNPGDYPVAMEFQKGYGHGGLPDRDKIKDMYSAQRNPVPKHLTWEPTDAHIKDFFWLSIDQPARGQSVDVQIAGNKVTVGANKVAQFSFWLDGRLVDLGQPIELIVNGKTSRHEPAPSLGTLCHSLLRRGDLNLAATWRVDF